MTHTGSLIKLNESTVIKLLCCENIRFPVEPVLITTLLLSALVNRGGQRSVVPETV